MQARTESHNSYHGTAPVLRVRIHKSTKEKHASLMPATEGKKSETLFADANNSEIACTAGRVNLDWIPDDLIFD